MMRLNVMPCLKPFVAKTIEGNRNENLFKVINHIRFHNSKAEYQDLYSVSLELNKCLSVPLSASEISQLTKHVLKQPYKSTCKHFQSACQRCRYGHKKPKWRDAKGYWKVINRKNIIDLKYAVPLGMTLYLWDVIDTSLLNDDDKMKVMLLRESKGVDPNIDDVIKSYGVPVDTPAWNDYCEYYREI